MGLRAVMARQRCIAALVGLLAVISVRAETAYVTDRLQLKVYLTRDLNGQPLAVLYSGDAVEVLERDGSLALVTLQDGRPGWVRGAYIQAQEPARRRIEGVTAERDRLAAELERLRPGAAGHAAELEGLRGEVRAAREVADAAQAELALRSDENRRLRDDLRALENAVPLRWSIAAVVIALLLGAFGAWRWFDYRSRKRHGGFRIY